MFGRLQLCLCILLAALPVSAQTYAQRFWFPDGAGVELHTEATGSTQQTELSGGGRISSGQKGLAGNLSRFVVDSHNQTVFAYGIEARKASVPDAIAILLKPNSGGPTVSAVREFPAVKYGQEVKIEILANPSTGEKVYDVLRPVEGPNPAPGRSAVQGVWVPKLVVNGKVAPVKSSWAAAESARLYVPGHGAYFLSWENQPNYRLAGYVEKDRLIFLMDGDYVEMTFKGNVLPAADGGPVWVYHDPGFVPESHGGAVTCLLDSYR
jgi:hypothetical protein